MIAKPLLVLFALVASAFYTIEAARCGNLPSSLKCAENAICEKNPIPVPIPGLNDSCVCNEGFVGDAYEDGCIDAAQCAIDQGCADNTACGYDEENGSYTCECAPDFVGNPDDGCIDQEECITEAGGCGTGAVCRYYDVIGKDFFACYCDSGLVGDPKKECISVDECGETAGCGENTVCTFYQDEYICDCQRNYVGNPYDNCLDQDTCKSQAGCGDNTACSWDQFREKFVCSCAETYIGDPYDGCIAQDSCTDEGICGENTFCNYKDEYVCSCLGGYEGDPYNQIGCKEINECAAGTDLCAAHAYCENVPGVYECVCDEGFQGGPYADDLGCYDCVNDNWFCGAQGVCMINQTDPDNKSYYCDCTQSGFTGDYCEQGEVVVTGSSSGVLKSANYPGKYAYDLDLHWTIKADEGYGINLVFVDFHTEEDFDVLKISDSTTLLQTYSGDDLPIPMWSSDNMLYIDFSSDDGKSKSGWMVEFKTSQQPECVSDSWICQQGGKCSIVDTEEYTCDCTATGFDGTYCDRGDISASGIAQGEISSINYPYAYPNNVDSAWNIIADDGYGIEVSFMDFNTQAFNYDKVTISDSVSVIWEYSGAGMEDMGKLVSNDNILNIQFTTDDSVTDSGWKLQWKTFAISVPATPCQTLSDPDNGMISCSDLENIGSECIYQCNNGFGLVGYPILSCIGADEPSSVNNGWDNAIPSCQSLDEDPTLAAQSSTAETLALTFIITTAVLFVVIVAGACYLLRDSDEKDVNKETDSSVQGSQNNAFTVTTETPPGQSTRPDGNTDKALSQL